MVKVKNGMKSDATPKTPKSKDIYLCQKTKSGIVFFVSTSSKLEGGKYLTLLTAIARQCTVHRSIISKQPHNEQTAEVLLRKWVKMLPISSIN